MTEKYEGECTYCGKWHTNMFGKKTCYTCAGKTDLLPRFREARDNLREKLDLERMYVSDDD